MTAPPDPGALTHLHAALAALTTAENTAAAAAEQLREARDRAHHALREHADSDPPPPELLRTLYWDHPDIHVKEIAAAFGLPSATDVYRHTGHSPTPAACKGGCGKTRRPRSRDDARQHHLCATCAAKRQGEIRAGTEEIRAGWEHRQQEKEAETEPAGITHGLSGYHNYRCHCPTCRAANAAHNRAYRGLPIDPGKHGTQINYTRGCKCDPCLERQARDNSTDVRTAKARAWATAAGMPVKARGRLPRHVLDAYTRHLADQEGTSP